jgi:hypothetical protein
MDWIVCSNLLFIQKSTIIEEPTWPHLWFWYSWLWEIISTIDRTNQKLLSLLLNLSHIPGSNKSWESQQITKAKGHFTHESVSPWPLHSKHSHLWKRQSRSKFASHYAWGTDKVCECRMDLKSSWIPTWHQMDHVSWSLGLFSKTTSWR